jgi:hypothetical protein
MVIDSSEAEVVEWRRAKRIKDSRCSCASLNRAGRDGFEQALKLGFGHDSGERNTGKAPVSLNFA